MINKRNHRRMLGTLAALFLFSIGASFAATGSYTVDIPQNSSVPLAWSFQSTTVSNAFPSNIDDNTTLQFWSSTTTNYIDVNTYIVGYGWTAPNFVITNGVGFWYGNPLSSTKTLTVTGTLLTASAVTNSFLAGKTYFLASAYLQPDDGENWLECVHDNNNIYRYTLTNLNYSSSVNDVVYTWNDGDWRGAIRNGTNCSYVAGSPYWSSTTNNCAWSPGELLSPSISKGKGFWFYPVSNVSWVQYLTRHSCP